MKTLAFTMPVLDNAHGRREPLPDAIARAVPDAADIRAHEHAHDKNGWREQCELTLPAGRFLAVRKYSDDHARVYWLKQV